MLIAGGNSYVGLSDHTRSVRKTWLLNPSTGDLVNGTDMKRSKSDHACTVFEDKVYVVAVKEAETEVFDPATGNWSAGPTFPFPPGEEGSLAVIDNTLVFRTTYRTQFLKRNGTGTLEWKKAYHVGTGDDFKPLAKIISLKFDNSCNLVFP